MSYSRNTKRGNRSRSLSGEEVRIPIPKDKVGLVIGRKGGTVQEIRDRTGVQISIKNNHAHLRGTTEQCNNARDLIEEILKVKEFMTRSLSLGVSFLLWERDQVFIEQQICAEDDKIIGCEVKG